MQKTQTAYHFDTHGYLIGSDLVLEGQVPADDTLIAPKIKNGYWSKFDGAKWSNEKIPTTAAELVSFKIEHEDRTAWASSMRVLMNVLCTEDSGYRVARGDDLSLSVELVPEKTFAELQNAKYETLSSVSSKYQAWNCSDMYVTSSLGFKVNADQCSQNNISILINLLEDTATTSFKVYDNSFKILNKSQLQTLLKECQQNGLALYQQKFAIQAEIAKATTKEELDAIVIDFVNADYSL